MTAREPAPAHAAGLLLGAWFLVHAPFSGDSGPSAWVAPILLLAGVGLRLTGRFISWTAECVLLFGAIAAPFLASWPAGLALGWWGTLAGAILLLRPLTPARGLWAIFCALAPLTSAALEESIGTVILISDVAVLILLAQLVLSPAGSGGRFWASLGRSMRLVVPVGLAVTLLFRLFPTISARANSLGTTGFYGGGTMSPGDSQEIRRSKRPAFSVEFFEGSEIPPASCLYWRGQVLEKNEGLRWLAATARVAPSQRPADPGPPAWRYRLQLGAERILVPLDRPVAARFVGGEVHSTVLFTQEAEVIVPGVGQLDLDVVSSPAPADDPPDKNREGGCLDVPPEVAKAPGLRKLAARFFREGQPVGCGLEAFGKFLAGSGFSYTLRPGTMASSDVEGFFLRQKKGFCEHYAAASATLIRMGGIPARVVTGFRGGLWNPWIHSITVGESDAHAWVEAWDAAKRCWVRFDPTDFVAPELAAGIERNRDPTRWTWMFRTSTQVGSTATLAWRHLAEQAGSHPVAFCLAMACAAGGLAAWAWGARRRTPPSVAAACLASLEKSAPPGLRRQPGETPLAWLERVREATSPAAAPLAAIFSEAYERAVYARSQVVDESSLRAAAKSLEKHWRRLRG